MPKIKAEKKSRVHNEVAKQGIPSYNSNQSYFYYINQFLEHFFVLSHSKLFISEISINSILMKSFCFKAYCLTRALVSIYLKIPS